MASLEDMRHAIGRYRRGSLTPGEDPMIGCILLRDVYFARPGETVAGPSDFAKNVVRGKGYEIGTGSGSYVEDALRHLLQHSTLAPAIVPGPVFGIPRLVAPRVGQQAFKALVQTAYHRRCAITGARITPTLQAAHIRPVGREHGGENRVDNGLLLRSDVHTLFDRGYLGVDTRSRLHVSPRLRSDFGNGQEFYLRASTVIDLPDVRANRPSAEAVSLAHGHGVPGVMSRDSRSGELDDHRRMVAGPRALALLAVDEGAGHPGDQRR